MKFTHEYFPDHIKNWENTFSFIKDQQNINYLEVGVFEGQSAFWMKENILTHPTCEVTLVDLFHPSYEKRFLENLSEVNSENIIIHKGNSSEILKNLTPNYFDIIYVDGGHIAKDTFLDLAYAWDLLKADGILVIDDYPLLKDDVPIHIRPGLVIDLFITSFSEQIEILHKDWQVIIKKKEIVLKNPDPYSWNKHQKVGNYFYDWHKHQLLDEKGKKANLELTSKEKLMLEVILKNIKLGDDQFTIEQSLKDKAGVSALLQKLSLKP